MERLKERDYPAQSLTFEAEEKTPGPPRVRKPPGNNHDLLPNDVFQIYLEEIKNIPLLTYEEEQKLFRIKERGEDAKRRLNENHDLPDQEKLAVLIQQGEQARGKLVIANQRLVISIARKYIGQGVPFPDLVQEGNIGLTKAIDKFDPSRGNRLATYATWWIRKEITEAVPEQGPLIRLPLHWHQRRRKLRNAQEELAQKLGREPTVPELAAKVEIPAKKVNRFLEASRLPVSLQTPTSGQDGGESTSLLGDFIADETVSSPTDSTSDALLREQIEEALDSLTPREARILRLRYGLWDGHAHTLREVGEKLGLTRERIRQIEAKAKRKLRHPSRARKLRDFARE